MSDSDRQLAAEHNTEAEAWRQTTMEVRQQLAAAMAREARLREALEELLDDWATSNPDMKAFAAARIRVREALSDTTADAWLKEREEALLNISSERDMAEAYYKTLEAHLREHGCDHSFSDVANGSLLASHPEPLDNTVWVKAGPPEQAPEIVSHPEQGDGD